jgi:hypothetical protein
MPNPKQMDKLAREAALRRERAVSDPGPHDPMPDQLWDAVLDDPRARAKPAQPIHLCPLSEIGQHVLRVECQRCSRIVEIQTADAVRFYGPNAFWKDVGLRLLDQTCTNRTGRLEEDGCWPDWTSEDIAHTLK